MPLKNSLLLASLTLVMLLQSCYRRNECRRCAVEPRFDGENSCNELEDYDPTGLTVAVPTIATVSVMSSTYDEVHFNPNNGNEFLFYKTSADTLGKVTQLLKYDLVSEQLQVMQKSFSGTLGFAWGSNNVVAIAGGGSAILFWDLESGEEKLVKVAGQAIHPSWIPGTQKLVVAWDGDGVSSWCCHLIYDYNTHSLDTLESIKKGRPYPRLTFSSKGYGNSWHDFNNDGEEKGGFGIFHIDELRSRILLPMAISRTSQDKGRIKRFNWDPEGENLYYLLQGEGIFRTSTNSTFVEVRIKKNCGNRYESDFAISPDGNKMIVVRNLAWVDEPPEQYERYWNGWTYIKQKLVIMDIDGCNEQVLDI